MGKKLKIENRFDKVLGTFFHGNFNLKAIDLFMKFKK
jgi:hypothetical protein